MHRIERLKRLCERLGGDALYISSIPDIRWACGFTGSNGVLLVRVDAADLITDGRYRAQAADEVEGAVVHAPGYDLIGHVADAGLLDGARHVICQSDHLTVDAHAKLRDRLPHIDWEGRTDVLAPLVAVKTSDEIDRIRAAQRLTEDVYESLLSWIRPGQSEKSVAAEIVCRHLKGGAERMAFDPIVASGPNSALPHARPTGRRIERGDLLLLDFGCILDGYASDMTRVVSLGESDPEARTVYDLVIEAQQRALDGVRAGMASREVDALARDVIRDAGYGDAFVHSLGHGLGLQVHEWPRVTYAAEYAIPEDCVVTIEPGVYLPGRFGVRIEDVVAVRNTGCENLTRASKAWTIL
ncbi:MAG: aminopeptidase P family protein [Rhodothermales bacterium]